MTFKTILIWLIRVVPALIMLQTLYFKFSASEESVYIFSQIGMEPWGRIGTGFFELIASVLLLWTRTTHMGAMLGAGLMSGALFFHLTKLGIVVKGDGGLLFSYAIIVMLSCLLLILIHWKKVIKLIPLINKN